MARGYSASADVLRTTVDGKDLNDLWREFQATLDIVNDMRTGLVGLFTAPTILPGDEVAQTTSDTEFEEASEYGVPQGTRLSPSTVAVGFPLKWYDLAKRMTYQFLRDATAAQVEAVHLAAQEADNRLIYTQVMKALFTNVSPGMNDKQLRIQPLWNGDGTVPPDWGGNSFAGVHSHYMVSGTAVVDGNDVADLTNNVLHHGYGLAENGDRLIVLVHPFQGETISGFRAGVNNSPYDFIPSDDGVPFITDEVIVGERPPGNFQGLKVIGQFGRALIVENHLVPMGYMVALSTAGAGSPRNPLALREHVRPEHRGLKQIRGSVPEYPLQDSFYVRGFGVGVRHRGAAAVMQIKSSGTYDVPTVAVR